ncbi:hypothetical protein D9M68_949420 [compost metagenome]
MGFDDFDIHVVAEHPRRSVEQLQAKVDADTEVGREDDRDLLAGLGQQLLLLRRKAGGADNHRLAGLAANLQVLQGDRRMGKVDQHIESIQHGSQIT